VVAALGTVWILDGLEVTIVGGMGSVLQNPETLKFTSTQVGLQATIYLIGALIGTKEKMPLTLGYLGGAVLLLIAAGIELAMGVRAEQESLEDVAAPLAAEDGELGDGGVRDGATRSTGGVAGSPSTEA
jgi:hypothetical protein